MNQGTSLAKKKCAECEGNAKPLDLTQARALKDQLHSAWSIQDQHHLAREFQFKDFRQAMAFANRVAELAEAEGHHPDFQLGWGYVRILIWTHTVNGLTEGDFVLAAKIDQLM